MQLKPLPHLSYLLTIPKTICDKSLSKENYCEFVLLKPSSDVKILLDKHYICKVDTYWERIHTN